MTSAVIAVIFGLVLLVWSADRFVEGSASTARHFGMPPLLIGMVIVGFGTSAPEMVVSALAASQGNPGIALGNAYGSNITNIALILGITALISPITVHSQVLRKENCPSSRWSRRWRHGNSGMARSPGVMPSCCLPCSAD
jgi:cation:H+ antiporter